MRDLGARFSFALQLCNSKANSTWMRGNFGLKLQSEIVRNCLTYMLYFIVMQMRKVNRDNAYSLPGDCGWLHVGDLHTRVSHPCLACITKPLDTLDTPVNTTVMHYTFALITDLTHLDNILPCKHFAPPPPFLFFIPPRGRPVQTPFSFSGWSLSLSIQSNLNIFNSCRFSCKVSNPPPV